MPQKRSRQPWDDPRWKKLSREVIFRAGGRCFVEGCTRPATTTDHIQPHSEAPHLFYDRSNLRASCREHNSGRVTTRAAAIIRANQNMGTRRAW